MVLTIKMMIVKISRNQKRSTSINLLGVTIFLDELILQNSSVGENGT